MDRVCLAIDSVNRGLTSTKVVISHNDLKRFIVYADLTRYFYNENGLSLKFGTPCRIHFTRSFIGAIYTAYQALSSEIYGPKDRVLLEKFRRLALWLKQAATDAMANTTNAIIINSSS